MSAPIYPEMIVLGPLQGVSELFPVSSLGHSVLLPALLGGQWAADLDMSATGSAIAGAGLLKLPELQNRSARRRSPSLKKP